MVENGSVVASENRIKTYRWFFYISLLQLLAFFIVPAFVFPIGLVLHIEIISALTLGLVVALFFLLVNVCGLYIDKSRRPLYVTMLIIIGLWFLWAVISWSYIERMDYLLR
ncbi:MAG: hypothetical protein ABII79_07085 [bacterium]